MKTSLEHLSTYRRGQIQKITQLIRELISPEKILLFGVWAIPGTLDVEFEDGAYSSFGTPDLLVVTRKGDKRDSCHLQDRAENSCRNCGPVTVLIHDIDYVNRQIKAGHYFFSTIRQESVLLFDACLIPLAEERSADLYQIWTTAGQDFEKWSARSLGFYRSAIFNCQQKEWKIAVFLLHQAAEHIYQAILLSFTGYKPTTHNLDKLRRYTNRFSVELSLLFPRNSEAEERIFRLLLQGYVEARYSDAYVITEQEVLMLAKRISQMISIAERVCKNRLNGLEKSAMLSLKRS